MTTFVTHNQKAHYHFIVKGENHPVIVEEYVRKGQKGYDRCTSLSYPKARQQWAALKPKKEGK